MLDHDHQLDDLLIVELTAILLAPGRHDFALAIVDRFSYVRGTTVESTWIRRAIGLNAFLIKLGGIGVTTQRQTQSLGIYIFHQALTSRAMASHAELDEVGG